MSIHSNEDNDDVDDDDDDDDDNDGGGDGLNIKQDVGLKTLYNPKNPSSLHRDIADGLCPATSPATCIRIFTISIGFVNITWAAPPWNAKHICSRINVI